MTNTVLSLRVEKPCECAETAILAPPSLAFMSVFEEITALCAYQDCACSCSVLARLFTADACATTLAATPGRGVQRRGGRRRCRWGKGCPRVSTLSLFGLKPGTWLPVHACVGHLRHHARHPISRNLCSLSTTSCCPSVDLGFSFSFLFFFFLFSVFLSFFPSSPSFFAVSFICALYSIDTNDNTTLPLPLFTCLRCAELGFVCLIQHMPQAVRKPVEGKKKKKKNLSRSNDGL